MITDNNTKQFGLDAIFLTSYTGVIVLELITITGHYKKDSDDMWREEEEENEVGQPVD